MLNQSVLAALCRASAGDALAHAGLVRHHHPDRHPARRARRRNTAAPGSIPTVMFLALVGVSVPGFWIAISRSSCSASTWAGCRPAATSRCARTCWAGCRTLQPAAMLALLQVGLLARITRSTMLEVLRQDYIRTARAKGAAASGRWWRSTRWPTR